jgi:hypothetical protein
MNERTLALVNSGERRFSGSDRDLQGIDALELARAAASAECAANGKLQPDDGSQGGRPAWLAAVFSTAMVGRPAADLYSD